MRSLKNWTLQEIEIYNRQHECKAWLATVNLKEAKTLIKILGTSRIELRHGKVYSGVPLVDVYLKGYAFC